MKLLTTKYAAELNALDIGDNIQISWIKSYRYKGEQREKVISFPHITRIVHTVYTTHVWWKSNKSDYWPNETKLDFDNRVAVYDLDANEDEE